MQLLRLSSSFVVTVVSHSALLYLARTCYLIQIVILPIFVNLLLFFIHIVYRGLLWDFLATDRFQTIFIHCFPCIFFFFLLYLLGISSRLIHHRWCRGTIPYCFDATGLAPCCCPIERINFLTSGFVSQFWSPFWAWWIQGRARRGGHPPWQPDFPCVGTLPHPFMQPPSPHLILLWFRYWFWDLTLPLQRVQGLLLH